MHVLSGEVSDLAMQGRVPVSSLSLNRDASPGVNTALRSFMIRQLVPGLLYKVARA